MNKYNFFLKLAFGQVCEKKLRQRLPDEGFFQKRVLWTKLDIYVFIMESYAINYNINMRNTLL